jgi:RNA polymerase sigma-32 factor
MSSQPRRVAPIVVPPPTGDPAAAPPPSPAEQRALCRRWQIFGDKGARDRLLAYYESWVRRYARGFSKYGVDDDDLIQEGYLGLLTALLRFEPLRGPQLSTYVVYWIRLRMIVLVVRLLGPVRIESIAVAEAAMLDGDDLLGHRLYGGSLDDRRYRHHARALPDPKVSAEEQLLVAAERTARARWLERAVAALETNEREVLRARHLRDQPIEHDALAERMALSPKAVRRLERRALARLFAAYDGSASAHDVLFGGRRLRVMAPPRQPQPPSHRRRLADARARP